MSLETGAMHAFGPFHFTKESLAAYRSGILQDDSSCAPLLFPFSLASPSSPPSLPLLPFPCSPPPSLPLPLLFHLLTFTNDTRSTLIGPGVRGGTRAPRWRLVGSHFKASEKDQNRPRALFGLHGIDINTDCIFISHA